jgi:hypothetical protein
MMKAVRIDFAKSSLRRALWKARPAHWLLCIAGTSLCASAGILMANMAAQQHVLDAQRDKLHTKNFAESDAAKLAAIPVEQAKAVNNAIGRLNVPWIELREAIDEATTSSVAVLMLEPLVKSRTLKIVAEARSPDDMFFFMEQLKHQEFFSGVVLIKHSIDEKDPNRPIRFHLEAHWGGIEASP